jgi:serine/threonine protein kinase
MQVGAEKFLWETRPTTVVASTPRGFLRRGSVGEVEEVAVPNHSTPMARKCIFISRMRQEAERDKKRVREEIDHLKSLIHPHIIKVLGCYQGSRGSSLTIYVLLFPTGEQDLGLLLRHMGALFPLAPERINARLKIHK